MYLEHRSPELSTSSVQNHRYRLNKFADFCEEKEIEDLNDLTGRDLHRFRTWRSQQDVSTVTLRTNLATLRVFLEFCASIDAVEQGLREKVVLPEVDPEEESKTVKLEEDRANAILDHLDRFRYASREHVIMAILWHTGIRIGTLRAFDLRDWDPDEPCLEVRHRPETETPLKNTGGAERAIAVGDYYAKVISDYIEHNRIEATDDYGREPLITSSQGRYVGTSIRTTIYRWTQPCRVGSCPHDRNPEECEATKREHLSKCPSTQSPHAIRRGALTRMLREGVPEQVVGDRCNVSKEVLEKHYDQRTERERMDIRRDFIDEL